MLFITQVGVSFLKELILSKVALNCLILFSKVALNYSKVTVNTLTWTYFLTLFVKES